MSVPVAVGIIGATVVLSVPILAVSASLETKHRAAAAADAAALAAADAFFGYLEGEPCDIARTVARANGASLELCETGSADVRVVVGVRVAHGSVVERARAGLEGIEKRSP